MKIGLTDSSFAIVRVLREDLDPNVSEILPCEDLYWVSGRQPVAASPLGHWFPATSRPFVEFRSRMERISPTSGRNWQNMRDPFRIRNACPGNRYSVSIMFAIAVEYSAKASQRARYGTPREVRLSLGGTVFCRDPRLEVMMAEQERVPQRGSREN